ncbi:alpha/beta hydrolase [Nonomuraea diastatica]|uniref:Alpha/beta hydrolase fold-3 domain-containing protein n=1 Tax=Nonomuraea diastatica TaxID=1848329 RepID=A0A4R4WMK4_9ACTN|nr:alpha/beta hydrolase fold domain-containing protein [Nonomuraea diastatica]TDD16995.1 hypothetical protein E1294_29200 [Nonomuraea diastatica]
MIIGKPEMDDASMVGFVEQLGVVAVSVDYRLAPEHPHPAPVEDCYAGLAWTAKSAAELGIDPGRLAVGGASAVGTGDVSPYAAPARAADLAGLPPAFVDVGELEVFRDECVDYAQRLAQAGVSTEFHLYPGAFHGFDVMVPGATLSRRAAAARVAALKRALRR